MFPLYAVYLRAYSLSRARAVIPADAVPEAKKLADLTAFALGVGDGPAKETPDPCAAVCQRVAAALRVDSVTLLLVSEASEALRGAVATAKAACEPAA